MEEIATAMRDTTCGIPTRRGRVEILVDIRDDPAFLLLV
jgi:hypothetical protein